MAGLRALGNTPAMATVRSARRIQATRARAFMTPHPHSKAAEALGLGWGPVRTGIAAVHRVEVECPLFLAEPKTVAVVGAPLTYGQPIDGVDTGPQALRDAGLKEALLKLGWRVQEHGDLKFSSPTRGNPKYEGPGMCRNAYAVGTACSLLADTVETHAREGRFVLTLGGDHSIAMGTIAGILRQRPQTGVVWVDAHSDINTPEITGSGNMHGMPLAFLSGLVDPSTVPGCEWLSRTTPQFNPSEALVYIGLRDIDMGERAIIRHHGIKTFTMAHVDRYGIGKVMEMALDYLGERPLHLSYDIDACDPLIAPSTGTAVRGGLTYREAHYVAEAVAETHRLGSMDLVEVNPYFNGEASKWNLGEQTVDLGLAITASALGNRII